MTDYYYNNDWQLLEERKDGDADPLNQYLWHPYYIDALAVRWYDADTNPGTGVADYYYLHDANYNVTAIANSSGAVVERGHDHPYGIFRILNGNTDPDGNAWGIDPDEVSDVGNTHWFTGRERDPETGLQLSRRRPYASHLGRWLTRDPIGYDGGLNVYWYVDSMPIRYIDPLGRDLLVPPGLQPPDDDVPPGLAPPGNSPIVIWPRGPITLPPLPNPPWMPLPPPPECPPKVDCLTRCLRANGVWWSAGVAVGTIPVVSLPIKPPGRPLGAPTPIWSSLLRKCGGRSFRWLGRRLNPYANAIAVGSGSYAAGATISCGCICRLFPNAY